MFRTSSATFGDNFQLLVGLLLGEQGADRSPLRLDAAILSSPLAITSRWNYAEGGQPLRVDLPMLEWSELWVIDTKDTPYSSNNSTSLAKSASERVRRSTL